MRCTAYADDSKEETMSKARNRRMSTGTLVLGAILTALVIILQCMGQFIRFGPFSISLVLIPIVIGAVTCGPMVGAWLGFVFGMVVLFTDAGVFLAISVPGTIVTVMAKGIACGLTAGLVCRLAEKKSRYLAVVSAAVICPIVNTGIFLIGCLLFFFETVQGWGAAGGYGNTFAYMILGLVGANFLFEMASNIILSPVIVRILEAAKRVRR